MYMYFKGGMSVVTISPGHGLLYFILSLQVPVEKGHCSINELDIFFVDNLEPRNCGCETKQPNRDLVFVS